MPPTLEAPMSIEKKMRKMLNHCLECGKCFTKAEQKKAVRCDMEVVSSRVHRHRFQWQRDPLDQLHFVAIVKVKNLKYVKNFKFKKMFEKA